MDRRYRKKMDAYWARVEARGHREIDALEIADWFDYWHTHVDWDGRGERHPETAVAIAATALRLLAHLEARAEAAARAEPLQTWATLCADTASTAIWAHSPNPHGTPWPHAFPGGDWDAPVPDWLTLLVPDTHRVGAFRHDGETDYVVRRRLPCRDAAPREQDRPEKRR